MDQIVRSENWCWLNLPIRAVSLNVEVLGATGDGVSQGGGPSLDADIEVDDQSVDGDWVDVDSRSRKGRKKKKTLEAKQPHADE